MKESDRRLLLILLCVGVGIIGVLLRKMGLDSIGYVVVLVCVLLANYLIFSRLFEKFKEVKGSRGRSTTKNH